MSDTPSNAILISYARKDGFAPSQLLRERLLKEGIPVWQDLIAMNIGENWHPQIFKAIEEASAVVMVLTPEALKSPMVRQEWVHARRVGTPIFPVALSDIYADLDVPRWVQKVDAVILSETVVGSEEKWQTFLRQIRQPAKVRRVPNMVDKLPNEYVERQALYQAILAELLDDSGLNPRHTAETTHIITLLGEGGFGKTTLCQALGLDININEVFTGGILFATIGESAAQLPEKWNNMLRAVTGDDSTVSDPIDQLKLKLQGDDFLIILDDVWNRTDIEPILRIPSCTYLISTRDETVAALASDKPHLVMEMRPEEARDVLLNYIPPDKHKEVTKEVREAFQDFGGQLGEWPLLLDIHGWVIREECQRGSRILDALAYVKEGLAEEGLDPFPRGQNEDTQRRTLQGSMNASLRRYTDEEKQRLYELAIFPDDTPIPQATALKLWHGTAGMSSFAGKKLLRRIAGHFCRFRVEDDDSEPVLRFHDKIREYLGKQLVDVPRLHQTFLGAYGVSNWWDLPTDEPYLWQQLAYHLREAVQLPQLRELLLDYHWLQAKLNQTSINDLIGDCRVYLATTTDDTVRLLDSALGMSAHVLSHDKTALAGQLVGRLMGHRAKHLEIQAFTNKLRPPKQTFFPAQLDFHPTHEQAGGALLRILIGHNSLISCCDFSPDGTRLLSGSEDHTLRIWDANTGEVLHTLLGHTLPINSCVFSPDGTRLLSASSDHTLRIWDANTGEVLHTLLGHSSSVRSCTYSPDGTRLLSGSEDHTLRIWDANTGEVLHTLLGHALPINSCVFSPDGTRLLSASSDHTLRMWDANTGEVLHTLLGHSSSVRSCTYSPDGTRLLSGSEDHTLRIWDANTGEVLHTLLGHALPINSCVFSPDGTRLLSASSDHSLRMWDANTGEVLHTLWGHTSPARNCVFSPDGNYILSAYDDQTLRLWDAKPNNLLHIIKEHVNWVSSCVFSPDGSYILSAYYDHTLKLWDTDTGELIRVLIGHIGNVSSCAFSPDGQYILSASADCTLKLWNASTGEVLHTLMEHESFINDCSYSLDGRYILSASADRTLKLWNASTGEVLHTLKGHTSFINGCAFSPDGQYILSASADRTLKLWNASTGEVLHTLRGHISYVNKCAFSPDGQYILSASADCTLKLWNTSTGEVLHTLRGHTSFVYNCAFSPDGQHILSASADRTLRLWNTQSGDLIGVFYGDGPIVGLAGKSDNEGLLIVAGDSDGSILYLRFHT